MEKVRSAYVDDPWFSDTTNTASLVFKDGLWWKGTQVCIPSFPAYIETILDEMHDAPYSGHVGEAKLRRAVANLWWWPDLRRDVTEWVKTCDVCQRNKGDMRKQGLLRPIIPATRAWDKISYDLITDLPPTPRGFDTILVVVDTLTKWRTLSQR